MDPEEEQKAKAPKLEATAAASPSKDALDKPVSSSEEGEAPGKDAGAKTEADAGANGAGTDGESKNDADDGPNEPVSNGESMRQAKEGATGGQGTAPATESPEAPDRKPLDTASSEHKANPDEAEEQKSGLNGAESPVPTTVDHESKNEDEKQDENGLESAESGEAGGQPQPVAPRVEEELSVRIVTNDGKDENMITLIHLKSIFSKQLPKMPRKYIVRLVFDRKHYSIALMKGSRVVGGICYRPVFEQGIAEIAFCAITATEQVKGLGTRMMNELKNHVKNEIRYFLTYADNYAIGYFKKQGFSKTVSMPREKWYGHIKDYDGGTLMECYIHPTIDHMKITQMIETQRKFIMDRIEARSLEHVVYPSLPTGEDGRVLRIENALDIPGVREAGWTAETVGGGLELGRRRDSERDRAGLQAALKELLTRVKAHDTAEIFAEPVDVEAYPDYLSVCRDPIDLRTISERLQEKPVYYRSREMLFADLMRMVENCKKFNPEGHEYHMQALRMEVHVVDLFQQQAGRA